MLRHPAVCLGFLAASWMFYAPPRNWPGLTYFGYGQDPLAFIWFLNWWPFALAHHLNPLFTRYVDFPAGVDLVWKTSVPALALLAAPFSMWFGAVAVFNVLMIASPALAAFGAYVAMYELTGVFGAALTAGLLFGMSGYEIGQAQAHLNLAFTVAVPLCLWACLRAARYHWPVWLLGLVLGLLLTFQFGVSQEVFATLVLMAGCGLAVVFWLHPAQRGTLWRLLPGIALGLAICAVVISPLLWQMLRWYAAEQSNLSSPDTYANDLLAFVLPTPATLLGGRIATPVTRLFSGNYTEQGGYLGVASLSLLGFITWRCRTPAIRIAAIMLILASVFSLGPHLYQTGHKVSLAPWFVFSKLPFLSGVLPSRLSLYMWLAAACMVALWLARPGGIWRYVAVAICVASIAPAQSFDRRWTHLAVPGVFSTLPHGAHVLVLPEFGQEMGWQYATGMRFKLVGQGYVGTGRPMPFAHWPMFEPLWENHFAAVDPANFALYLAKYGVQDVVILPHGYGLFGLPIDDAAAAWAAAKLLEAAGWIKIAASPDATLFRPPFH